MLECNEITTHIICKERIYVFTYVYICFRHMCNTRKFVYSPSPTSVTLYVYLVGLNITALIRRVACSLAFHPHKSISIRLELGILGTPR